MSLIIKEMEIRTTVRYHITRFRMTIKKTKNKKLQQILARTWRNWNTYALLMGRQTGKSAMENCMEIPTTSQTENRTTV